MASEIKLPELGENVTGGTVVDIRVSPGAQVKAGDTLLEVEAGKSTVEVPAPAAGRISEILVKRGQEVQTGQVLFKLETDGQATPADQKPAHTAEAAPNKSPARPAAKAAPPPKQPAKANGPRKEPLPSPATQIEREEDQREGEPEEVVQAAVQKQATPADQSRAAAPLARSQPAVGPDRPGRLVPASPATRLLARELGVDLSQVQGSGPHGRVSQEDVRAYVRQLAAGAAAGRATGAPPPPLPDFSKWGEVEHQPLDNIRRETARQMSLAWSLIPHVTQHDLADVTDLEAFRKAQSTSDVKVTVTAFALKAAAIALREFPQFNASLDLGRNQLVLKRYYHIGVAVDTGRGLLVPVIRDVDRKSIAELAEELADTADRARKRRITMDETSGGSFTLTNLGGIGGTGFTPIVNYPEVAILGLSRARLQPVVRDGQVTPRLLLPLSLSYDHRVIDGAAAAHFTRRLAVMLENPLVMLLHA